MDCGAVVTGRRLQVVLWWTSSFHLHDLVAPVLTCGSGSSRDAGEGGSIGVKSVLVILALSLLALAPNGWLRVESTVHEVDVVTVAWACVRGISLHSGVTRLLMGDSHVKGAVLKFVLINVGTVAPSTV
jgi:hypothetical protein